MYSILVSTNPEQVRHGASLGIRPPIAPKFRNWLKDKAPQRHSRVRQLELRRPHVHERTGQQQVDVDAPARVARTLFVAHPAEPSLHLKAVQKQVLRFAMPFYLKYLVQKVWTLKPPCGSAPEAACANHWNVLRQRCPCPAKNL